MRVYVVAVKGKLLLLRTDDRTALQLDNGESSMDEALFTSCLLDHALILDCDENGKLRSTDL